MENRNLYIVPAIVIGLCLIMATVVGAVSFYKIKSLSNVLSVTGSADKTITSDTVKWTSVVSRSVDSYGLKEGSTQIKNDLAVVKDYFKRSGIKDSEITVNPVTMNTICENRDSVVWDKYGNQTCGSSGISGYSLQQTIVVDSDKVSEITALSQAASDYFIGQGLIFNTQSLEYYYSKLADLRLDLLGEATKNAKSRADVIAKSTGKNIGSLQSATMGVFQVTAKNSVEVSDYGIYDTSSIEKKVTAVVRASFTLK
ncbi:MAG: SIMPL domain-containing protein [Candidatus Paceibacterota bacterium]